MTSPTPLERFDALSRRRIAVPGGRALSTVDVGEGSPPIVLLHGNPTWSYQWRDIIPQLASQRRVLAPDLLGFGRSDHPRIDFGWDVHLAAIAAVLDELPGHVVVGHDWGASFGARYAIDHPDRVMALVLMEPLLLAETWADYDPARRARFEAFRDPARNRQLIEIENRMVEEIANGVLRTLGPDEMAGYRAPFPTPADRVPIRRFAEMKPIGDESETWRVFQSIEEGLPTLRMPVRLLTVDGGPLMPPRQVERLRGLVPQLEVVHLGPGRHHFQEDYPAEIAAEILRPARAHGTNG